MNHTEIILTEKELFYLFQNDHIESVYLNFSDPFAAVSAAQKANLQLEAEESLREKGLRKAAFGGIVLLKPELKSFLEACEKPEKFICFDYRDSDDRLTHVRFLMQKECWYQIKENGDDYTIRRAVPDDIQACMKGMPLPESGHREAVACMIPKLSLKRVSRLFQSGKLSEAEACLKKLGLTENESSFLARGLQGQTGYAAVTLEEGGADGTRSRADSAILFTEDAMAELYMTVGADDRTMVGLRSAADGDYRKLMEVVKVWSIV